MTAPKYLSGTRSPYDAHWSKRTTRGDVLAEEHRKANPEPKAPVATLICLCLCVLASLAIVSWGWSLVNVYIADQVNVGITLD